jgi:hypothetical protein
LCMHMVHLAEQCIFSILTSIHTRLKYRCQPNKTKRFKISYFLIINCYPMLKSSYQPCSIRCFKIHYAQKIKVNWVWAQNPVHKSHTTGQFYFSTYTIHITSSLRKCKIYTTFMKLPTYRLYYR